MLKRVYYPINKEKIAEAIALYEAYDKTDRTSQEATELWDRYNTAKKAICPGSYVWAANFFQAMSFSGTLTVERVYYAILAMGINTVEVKDD